MAKLKNTNKQNAIVDETGNACWIDLMRKFTNANKPICKIADKPALNEYVFKKYATGSLYEGNHNTLGMYGYGAYEFPYQSNNVIYDGHFVDGEFHDEGEYTYEDGTILSGNFKKGTMVNRKLYFADGLIYTESGWLYCQAPDRRYTIEYYEGIQPGGASFRTADQPTREIDPELYDVGNGLFDSSKGVVHRYDDPTKLTRAPDKKETKWIKDNCRDGRDEPLGPMLFLYETYNNPQPLLPELPKPAAKYSISFDRNEDHSEKEYRRSKRSTIGAKFKAKFFYKYERPKTFGLSSSSTPGESIASNQRERQSSSKARTSQVDHEVRNRPDLWLSSS